jgi:hypothetical protein
LDEKLMQRYEAAVISRISDENWNRIKDVLPGKASDAGRTAQDNRLFINAVLRPV